MKTDHAGGPGSLRAGPGREGGVEMQAIRIGHGYDVHALFAKGGKLMLWAGWTWPASQGLLGHSDADACCCTPPVDSHPGRPGAGGHRQAHFPDTDPHVQGRGQPRPVAGRVREYDEGAAATSWATCDMHRHRPGPQTGSRTSSSMRRNLDRRPADAEHGQRQRQGHHRGSAWASPGRREGIAAHSGLPASKTGNFSGKTVTPDALPA